MTPENIANLIRLAADGEITAPQQALLDAYGATHPEVAEAVEFQRALRSAVGRSMGASDLLAPAGLEGRIRRALAEEVEAETNGSQGDGPFRFFVTVGRRQVPTSVAAGFLVLLGAAVVMSILGLPRGTTNFGQGSRIQVDSGLGFPAIEHVKCSSNRTYAQQKLTLHEVDQVRAHFVDELDWSVEVPDLSSVGFEFVDAGPCTLNGRSVESVHLRYRKAEEIVSIWLERALRSDLTHVADFVDGHAYEVIPTDAGGLREPSPSYYAWRRGEYVYRLVPASLSDARSVALAVGMPDVELEEFH